MRLPPASLALLAVTPVWCVFGFVMAGWLGVGTALIVLGMAQIGIAVLSMKSRPPRFRSLKEEPVGRFDKRGRLRLVMPEYRKVQAYRAALRRAA